MALVYHRQIKTLGLRLRKLGTLTSILTMISLLLFQATVHAEPVFDGLFAPYYNPGNACVAAYSAPGGVNTGVASDGTVWKSGLEAPYILEQFAVEVLKAVAKKRGVPEENTVTQEHIDALLAFMLGEGGDINNRWLFNPLNSGLSSDDLVDGAKQSDGTQSFKSFDAGVEATARTMTGKFQSRLADILINPETTATQFMFVLTYYYGFSDNKFWASASVSNPGKYYQDRLGFINQVRKNYKDVASTVIGTSAREYPQKVREPSKLRNPTGTPSTANEQATLTSAEVAATTCGVSSSQGSNGAVNGNVTQTAVNLAWPDRWKPNRDASQQYRKNAKTPKPEYSAAMAQFNKGVRSDGADCGVFVATVMRASGADPNYPAVGTAAQRDYVRSHKDKYDILEGPKSTADLQPGDILVVNNGRTHHTFIYVGPQPGSGYDSASASLNQRSANLQPAGWENLSIYTRARLK